MTAQDFDIIYGPGVAGEYESPNATDLGYIYLSSTGTYQGMIFSLPKTGIITHIGYPVTWIGSVNSAYWTQLSTVNDLGRATNTNYGGSSGTVLLGSDYSVGLEWIELSEHATGTVGDIIAARVECISIVDSYIAVGVKSIYRSSLPRHIYRSGYGTPQVAFWHPSVAIKYHDGEVYGLT